MGSKIMEMQNAQRPKAHIAQRTGADGFGPQPPPSAKSQTSLDLRGPPKTNTSAKFHRPTSRSDNPRCCSDGGCCSQRDGRRALSIRRAQCGPQPRPLRRGPGGLSGPGTRIPQAKVAGHRYSGAGGKAEGPGHPPRGRGFGPPRPGRRAVGNTPRGAVARRRAVLRNRTPAPNALHEAILVHVLSHLRGEGGGGDLRDPPTQIFGKPRDPEMSHPHEAGGGGVGPHPPTQQKAKKAKVFFRRQPRHPQISHPHGGGGDTPHPEFPKYPPTHLPTPHRVGQAVNTSLVQCRISCMLLLLTEGSTGCVYVCVCAFEGGGGAYYGGRPAWVYG